MAKIHHLQNREIAISQRKIIRFWWNLVHKCIFVTQWQSCDQTELKNSRWRKAIILKIVFGHNSASDCLISVKFCIEKQNDIGVEVRYKSSKFQKFKQRIVDILQIVKSPFTIII